MGRSPGKWIKTVLFGKKSKSRQLKNATPEKIASVRTPVEDSLVISAPQQLNENGSSTTRIKTCSPSVLCNTASGIIERSETQTSSIPLSDVEMEKENQAAVIVQAAFKGYLARRAFRALQGIIKLQALIRGHLVRRQAVATFHCMHGIVKLQAVVRGRNVRLSSAMGKDLQMHKFRETQVNAGAKRSFNIENLSVNSYIHKHIGSVSPAMPLALQYERSAPNSSSNWLDRWSVSRFWVPPARPIKALAVTTHRKKTENETVKSKRTFRRSEGGQNGDNGVVASLEIDPKGSMKKGYNYQTELAQEQAENELERVKRSLQKVSETVIEKTSAKTVPQPVEKAEKIVNPVTKANGVEAASRNETQRDLYPIEDHLNSPEYSPKEERIVEEKPSVKDRRSLPAKPEAIETAVQNTPPSLPSYMAATESAKAKLRASGSSKLRENGAGSGHVRRHSLPSSLNGKIFTPLSPRIQQPNSKGSCKSNRSGLSSRDDKVQPGWKR